MAIRKRTRSPVPTSGEFLRSKAVAHKLGISERKVLAMLSAGKIPGFKLGGTWLVAKSSLEKMLRKLIDGAEQKM